MSFKRYPGFIPGAFLRHFISSQRLACPLQSFKAQLEHFKSGAFSLHWVFYFEIRQIPYVCSTNYLNLPKPDFMSSSQYFLHHVLWKKTFHIKQPTQLYQYAIKYIYKEYMLSSLYFILLFYETMTGCWIKETIIGFICSIDLVKYCMILSLYSDWVQLILHPVLYVSSLQ